MLVKRLVYLALLQLTLFAAKAQCPQILDYLNNPSSNPTWISCTGAAYTLNFQSPSNFPGTYTISWGDASPDHTGTAYTASSVIPHVYSSTGSFVVTLMIPAQTCTMTGLVVVELAVNAALSIPIGGTLAGCSPANITFSNVSTNVSSTTQFTYIWGDNTPNSTFNSTNTSASHIYSAANVTCATSATLLAWNYCSFSSTSTAIIGPVNVYARDVAQITTSVQNKCWPDNVFTFTNTSVENCTAFGNNYQRKQYWKLGNYWAFNSFQDSIYPWTNIPPNTPVTVAFPTMGGFVVQLKDSNVCGVDSITQLVNIFNAPTASVIAPTGPFCTNSLMTFTNASSVGVFYKWDMGDGSGWVNFLFGPKTYSYATPATYTVRLVAFIPFGGMCSDTDQVVITILPGPTATFACSPTQSCVPLVGVTFTDNTVGPPVAWLWDFGNLNTSTLQVPAPETYTFAGTHTVLLIITAANGCQASNTQTIQVDAPPTGSFSATQVCAGSATTFTNLSIGATSYTWDYGDASPTSTVTNPTHTYASGGTYTVTLTTSNGICTGTYTNTAFVMALPVPNFVMTPTAGCAPLVVTFTNTTTGAVSVTWNFGDASPPTTVANPVHVYSSPTTVDQTYTITLVADNAGGCGDSIKKTVVLFGNPAPSFTFFPKFACSPFNVTFTNTSVGGTSNFWDLSFSNTTTATNPSQTYTNAAGSGSVTIPIKLVVTNVNGCKDSITDNIGVFAQPQAGFIADTAVCHPRMITFTNTSIGASTYSWNFGSSGSSTLSIPGFQYTNPGATPQASLTQLSVTNSDGCSHSYTLNSIIYPKPNIVYTAVPDSGCSPLRVNFPTVPGFTVYNWAFGNANSASTASASEQYVNFTAATRTFTSSLIASDIHGCSDTAAKNIRVFPAPVANFSPVTTTTLYLPEALVTFNNLTTGATSYTWSFGDGTSSTTTNTLDATHTYSAPNSYSVMLMAINSKGCRDTFKLVEKIIVLDDSYFQMPNAFTPNPNGSPGTTFNPADLSNDIFHGNMKGVVKIKFTIYSRWGEVMFATEDPTQGWDGYYKGKICNQDIYVYKIYVELYNGQIIDKTGDVTLLR
ncbi:MAG: PKD domain-containing protein [Sphingobacteriaceae bacterium]|nr:PKD domain-containing protein [Sphingobacteriaceae bacterium]